MFRATAGFCLSCLILFAGVGEAHSPPSMATESPSTPQVRHKTKAKKQIAVEVTAYSAKRKQNVKKLRGASGERLVEGSCAVSQDLLARGINYGDILHVSGVGSLVVLDTMDASVTKAVDVFFLTKKEAKKFGRITAVASTN